VSKTFGQVKAVKALDLVVARGGITGLLGPNGSGKTTTMRMVLSILMPDVGTIRVLGRDRVAESKHRIGYLPEDRGLYKSMKVGSFLTYMARLRGVPRAGLDKVIKGWLERVDLGDKLKEKCGVLSRGQQQRVQTIAALIHAPDLLILDEPFSGLDPVNRRVLSEIFAEQHARGCTLILSTHMMQHAEDICDHVVMMDRGDKVLDAPLAEVQARTSGTLRCEPVDPDVDLGPLEALDTVTRATRTDGEVVVELVDDADASATLAQVAAAVPMGRVEIERPTLEDVFVRIVGSRGATP
jgi:ABC-2 type transport system ATP-binding protein